MDRIAGGALSRVLGERTAPPGLCNGGAVRLTALREKAHWQPAEGVMTCADSTDGRPPRLIALTGVEPTR